MEPKESECAINIQRTRVIVYEFTFKEIIENFSNYLSLSDDLSIIESEDFYPQPNIWWKVRIQLDFDCLYIYLESNTNYTVDLHWKLSILDEKSNILYEKSTQEVFRSDSERVYHAIDESDVEKINQSKASDSVTLVINWKTFQKQSRTLLMSPSDTQVSEDTRNSLSQDLLQMYDKQLETDTTFKVQDETVGAHKAILSARSSVFAKMFQQEMAEGQGQVVDILDIKMTALKELLAFIYSGNRKDYDFETALDVYYAADKYEVLKLKEVCSLILVRKLDSENVMKLLQLADRHSDVVLKEKALLFLHLYFTDCVASENWIEFQNEQSELYREVIKYIKN